MRCKASQIVGQPHPRRRARGARQRRATVRRSSSPRTSTCASAPTRSASRPRTTTPRRSTSRSCTRATARSRSPAAAVDQFYAEGTLPIDAIGGQNGFYANQYLLLRDRENASHTALGRFDGANKKVAPVKKLREGVWGIRPRNKEQHFALDLLLNDDIKLVTLVGKAGTGKTLLAIAAGLQKCVEEGVYQKLLVSRPIFPLGRDIGFLPGDIEEKLNPWMQPIYDNVELLLGFSKADKKEGRSHQELIDLGYIEIEPLTYIRGRSIPNQYMIVDEAQNLTPHEVKTIITRVGENTKIILTGDPYQIDNPYVDASNNGLTTVVERFKDEAIAGHVVAAQGRALAAGRARREHSLSTATTQRSWHSLGAERDQLFSKGGSVLWRQRSLCVGDEVFAWGRVTLEPDDAAVGDRAHYRSEPTRALLTPVANRRAVVLEFVRESVAPPSAAR